MGPLKGEGILLHSYWTEAVGKYFWGNDRLWCAGFSFFKWNKEKPGSRQSIFVEHGKGVIIVGQGMSFWRGAGGLPWGAEGPCAAGSRHIVTPVCSRIFFFSSSTKLYGCRPEGRRCGCSLVRSDKELELLHREWFSWWNLAGSSREVHRRLMQRRAS